ncbi:AlpA family phage regulatory protein [Tateyamaria sp.]|nr:AlpA family phage regulatory protein [Tateyamaria sp.]
MALRIFRNGQFYNRGKSRDYNYGADMPILTTPQPHDQLIDIKTICQTLCRSRASIYRDIQRGDFPKPIKLGSSSRWRMSDLNKIIDPDFPMAA